MDLTTLVARLPDHRGTVVTYENGRVVRRDHTAVHADVAAARAKLAAWGVTRGARVGLLAPNCYEWIVHDLALIELRAVSVAFTDDFAATSPQELCDKYQLSLLLISHKHGAQDRAADAAFVAYLDADSAGVTVVPRDPPAADDGFDRPWLVFSSGSAGGLKGLVLSRKGIEASLGAFADAVEPQADDCLLLFLPMSNFQQRLMYYAALWYGHDIIVTDPSKLFRALKDLRPTILVAPPSLYEAVETRFSNLPRWQQIAAATLGDVARRLPLASARRAIARRLFKDAHQMFGDRMRFMVTGMAPIKRSTLELFARMQLPLYETYGAMECGSVSLNLPAAHRIGSVGRLLPGVRVDVATDGELLVSRTYPTALGYFESAAEESERTFLADGRVATGDIGQFDADGYLFLVGRKTEIIVTGGGEKLHPEAVEAAIDASPDVAKSVVVGGTGTPRPCAIVLPRRPDDASARLRIQAFIDGIGERRPSMRLDKVIFVDAPFTRENGMLRPNLKLDRRRIAEHFCAELGANAG